MKRMVIRWGWLLVAGALSSSCATSYMPRVYNVENDWGNTKIWPDRSNPAWPFFREGVDAAKDRRLSEAAAHYSRAIEWEKRFPAAFYDRGITYAALGNKDLAMADLNRAIEIDPRYSAAFCARAGLFLGSAEHQLAMADIEKALALEPGWPNALKRKGDLYFDLRQYDLAIAQYDAALSRFPGFVDAVVSRAYACALMGKVDQTRRDRDKLAELQPGVAVYLLERAELSLMVGDLEQSVSLSGVVKADPSQKSNLAASVFLECLALRLLGRETAEAEKDLASSLAGADSVPWKVDSLERWLEAATFSPGDKAFLREKIDMVKERRKELERKTIPVKMAWLARERSAPGIPALAD